MSSNDGAPAGTESYTNPKAQAKADKAYKKASRPWFKKKRWWALGLILIFGIAIANGMGGEDETPTVASEPTATAEQTAAEPSPTAEATTPAEETTTTEPAPPAAPDLTPGQSNALRAAENYLSFGAFSRQGLINQLSSEYGDNYSVEDATFAADNVEVDWNEQAAKAAQNYLDLSPFSRQGLIDQLTSEYGDGFTLEQATYGVDQAGL